MSNEMDLTAFFRFQNESRNQMRIFLSKCFDDDEEPEIDQTIILLALQGLTSIQENVPRNQFDFSPDWIKRFLIKWRNGGNFSGYQMPFTNMEPLLKSLTIFKTLQVPLFVSEYGERRRINDFDDIEDVQIDVNTKIYHVTHTPEAQTIVKGNKLILSDNKNIIPGVWFGIDDPVLHGSVYGNKSFEFTLKDFGITGLEQGEIVTYKQEVNVILYATDDENGTFDSLKKPREETAHRLVGTGAYVTISIFIPERIIEKYYLSCHKTPAPVEVDHRQFCVKQRNSRSFFICLELQEAS